MVRVDLLINRLIETCGELPNGAQVRRKIKARFQQEAEEVRTVSTARCALGSEVDDGKTAHGVHPRVATVQKEFD